MKLALRTIVIRSLGLLALSSLGGCSWLVGKDAIFDDSEYDYTNATMSAELEVPDSIGESNVQDNYLVPELDDDIEGVVYGVDVNILAPMQVLTLGNRVRVNRNSEYSSVYVSGSKTKLWSMIERYLAKENVPINSKDLESNTITTDWLVEEDDSFWSEDIVAWRQKYKIMVEKAARPSERILSIELVDAQELLDDTDTWRTVADPGRHQTEFLNSILGFMYVEDIDNSRQRVNQSALGGISVTLGIDAEGNASLITAANYEHVWSRVPISLRLLDISTDDQDRTQGLYFFRIADDEGFFESLKFWSSGPETLQLPEDTYSVKVAKLGKRVSITFFDSGSIPLSASLMSKNFPALSKAFRSRVSE